MCINTHTHTQRESLKTTPNFLRNQSKSIVIEKMTIGIIDRISEQTKQHQPVTNKTTASQPWHNTQPEEVNVARKIAFDFIMTEGKMTMDINIMLFTQ